MMDQKKLKQFLVHLPKAELHVHIEGTLEPEMMIRFAQRNNIELPYTVVNDAKKAYEFTTFSEFIAAYMEITKVLCTEQDFYELTHAYLQKAHAQGVLHAEIFFEAQSYKERGITIKTIVIGMQKALHEAQQKWGMSGGLILCFLRHLSAQSALSVLEESLPHRDIIIGVGLAAQEENNPPEPFINVFEQARRYGYHTVAHAGECTASNLYSTIHALRVERIDHGIQLIHEPALLDYVIKNAIPLTVCPLSNKALGVVNSLRNHPLKRLIQKGALVSINSDDPAFFGGYIGDNYYAATQESQLSIQELIQCAHTSFKSAFASHQRKTECVDHLIHYIEINNLLNYGCVKNS